MCVFLQKHLGKKASLRTEMKVQTNLLSREYHSFTLQTLHCVFLALLFMVFLYKWDKRKWEGKFESKFDRFFPEIMN